MKKCSANPVNYLLQLQKSSNAAKKQSILLEAWENNCRDLFDGIYLSLNPLYQFNISVVPKIIEEDDEPDTLGFTNFKQLATLLYEKNPNNKEQLIEEALNKSSVIAWNEWYRKILLKSIDCITPTQFNKFIKSVETNLHIPVIKPQFLSLDFLGKNFSKGDYFVDPYLSGDRILTVLQPTSKIVTQFDKNGSNIQPTHNFNKLVSLLPVGVVIDGVVSDSCYYLFDIMPLVDFSTGTVDIPQWKRHEALCELQDILAEVYKKEIRILPKKRIKISTTKDAKDALDELTEQGYNNAVFKKLTGKYMHNKNKNWVRGQ